MKIRIFIILCTIFNEASTFRIVVLIDFVAANGTMI